MDGAAVDVLDRLAFAGDHHIARCTDAARNRRRRSPEAEATESDDNGTYSEQDG